MSRIGCAPRLDARARHPWSRTAAAPPPRWPTRAHRARAVRVAGSATVTPKCPPKPWRSAMASASPASPPPPIKMSVFCMRPLSCAALGNQNNIPDRISPLQPIAILLDLCRSDRLSSLSFEKRKPPHVRRRPGAPENPRPRTARGEPVSRALAAGRLAARVRRPGDRSGAGRGLPHGGGPARAFDARLFPSARRSEGADHLRRRAHPRRQELHHAAA